jgi:hypothetical protein
MSFLDKATPINQATSTPSFTNKAKPVTQTQSTPVVETPVKEDGFFKSLAKDVAGTLVVKPVAKTTEALGRLGLFGSNIKKGYEDIADTGKGQNIMGINVEKQRGFSDGGVKQILGETAKTASYLVGGGALPNIARSTLGGKVLSGLVQGTKAGAVSGALYGGGQEAIKQESTVGSITKQAGIGGLIGGATGGVIGGVLPIPVASVQNIKPTNIMQRVARVNPLDEQKFQQTAKESIGEYLVKRGIYGNDEEIMKQLAQRFSQSKQVADEALEKLPGTYRPEPVKTALKEMLERETRISSPGAPSRDLARVQNLVTKYENKGVTMPEINEIKRIFERNNRLDYLKQNLPESIAKANTLDDAIRGWQFNQSKQLGLKNLDEVNKETRLAKQLGDALFKKNVRGSGNNAFGLTDAVLLSGGDPQAISMFLARQTFGNKNIQSKIAKTIAGKPTVGTPTAVFGSKISPKQAIPDVIIGKSKQNIPDVVVGSRASKPVNAVIPVTNTKLQAFKAGQGNSQGGYIVNPFQGKSKPKVDNQVVSSGKMPEVKVDLVSDPKNFKTADEFVKAQGIPMYHGSRSTFDKFETANTGKNSLNSGIGFYLADNPKGASTYGNVIDFVDTGKGKLLPILDKPSQHKAMLSELADGDTELLKKLLDQDVVFDSLTRKALIDKYKSTPDAYLSIMKKYGHRGYDIPPEYALTNSKTTEHVRFSSEDIKTRAQLTDIWNKANTPVNQKLANYKAGKPSPESGHIANPFQGKSTPRVSNQVVSSINSNTTPLKVGQTKPNTLDPKNFKSAEEFVKAQGEVLYHGGADNYKELKKGTGTHGDGVYLAKGNERASSYASKDEFGNSRTPVIVEAIADIKNPIVSTKTYTRGQFGKTGDSSLDKTLDVIFDAYGGELDGDNLLLQLQGSGKSNSLAEKLGFDGYTSAQDVVVFDTKNVKTKPQLTDIWNKANAPVNQKLKETITAKADMEDDIILENIARIKDITQIEPDDAKRFVELRRKMVKVPLSEEELAEAKAIIERSQGELPEVV